MTRRGTTLLEIVVALSLAAMLMVALSGVLAGLVRQRRQAEVVDSREWIHSLDRIFWNDLAQARSVALSDGVLWMVLPNSNSPTNNGFNSIAYRLTPTDKERFALVRAVYRDPLVASKPMSQKTLAWNVRQASFERVDDSGRDQPFPPSLGPAPRAFRYRLWFTNKSEPITQQITVR